MLGAHCSIVGMGGGASCPRTSALMFQVRRRMAGAGPSQRQVQWYCDGAKGGSDAEMMHAGSHAGRHAGHQAATSA